VERRGRAVRHQQTTHRCFACLERRGSERPARKRASAEAPGLRSGSDRGGAQASYCALSEANGVSVGRVRSKLTRLLSGRNTDASSKTLRQSKQRKER
jgi:hypothetical protein